MPVVVIKLAFIWVAVMLTYLLGDVLRIFSGEASKLSKDIRKLGDNMWLLAAMLMVIPIVMIVLTLFLPYEINRWANIIAAVFFFIFNLIGLPSYSWYDRFLLIVSMGFNVVTVVLAWGW